MDRKVARRYATALFHVAQREDQVAAVEADLEAIHEALTQDANFRAFLASPEFGREVKIGIVERVLGERVHPITLQAMRVLLSKRRENEIELVREELISRRRELGNTLFVKVTSAEPLDELQSAAIRSRIESQTGKFVEVEYAIDPNVMGGARVAFGNYVLDGTVRGSLHRLRDQLKYDLLKQN